MSLAAAAAVAVAAVATPAAAQPRGPGEDDFTFIGGGWGHGMGLSQFGALGRAGAGHTHEEILGFYYDGAEVSEDPDLVPDDVDVRLAVHNTTVFRPTGLLDVFMDGRKLDDTRNPLTVRRGDGGWHINSSNIDWCPSRGFFCSGTVLTVRFKDGEPVRVSNTANGAERFARGEFQLTPAAGGIANCGSRSANEYCLVVGELTMQQYLYGLDEVPHNWPAEALKAQAIAARSFAAAIMAERVGWASPFDLYASTRDQEYTAWDFERELGHEAWKEQVDATDDTVLTYQRTSEDPIEAIVAYYSSSNGGHTAAHEEPRRVSVPYLAAKPDPFDAALDENGDPQNPNHSWERTYTGEQISKWLADYPFADLDVGDIAEVYITGPGPSGRIDDALVTLVGSERTLEVRNEDAEPYGYRFYYALVRGCRATPGCRPPLSTKLVLQGARGNNVHTVPFADVAWDALYAPAVTWMLDNDITTGTTATTFSPERPLTRAQFATFLWRFAGEPEPEGADGSWIFADVEPDGYYAEAVGWMWHEGIAFGCKADPDRLFCPNERLTTSQLAAFLWRFAGELESDHLIPFQDVGVNASYLEAARWMVEHRIWVDEEFEPLDDPKDFNPPNKDFNPPDPVTRGRISVFVWKLAGSPGAFAANAELPPLMRDQ